MKMFTSCAARRARSHAFMAAAGTLSAVVLGFAGIAATAAAPQEESALVPMRLSRPTFNAAQIDDPRERREAYVTARAPHMTEDYKLNFLRELARQQHLYPNQMAGAQYPDGIPRWRSIGPRTAKFEWNGVYEAGIDSGRIRTILTDPADSDHVYVLTSGGGLWVTSNFSDADPHWHVLTDALLSTSGGSVAFGRDSKTLYLGIGDPFDVSPTIAGVIVKSTDGGRSWAPIVNLPNATQVREIRVDTSQQPDVVLVGTDVGLYVSTDGGTSYTLSSVAQASGKYSVWSMARSSAGWLLNAVDPLFDYNNGVQGGTGDLYISADRGATWNAIASGSTDPFSSVGRATLALGNPGESTVYAIASDSTGFHQADTYRSSDGGLTWSALNMTGGAPTNPNCFQTDLNILGDQAYYNQMIVVSPLDKNRGTLYIGGNLSTAKTRDGGVTWTLTSDWLPTGCDGVTPVIQYVHADNHTAAISVAHGVERIVFGTDGGIFVSEDGGQTFDSSKNVGIVALLAQTISSTPKRDDSAITGAQDNGTRARIGSSKSWNQVLGGDGEGVAWSQANNAVTIATAEFYYMARQPGLPSNTGDPNNWLDATNGIDFNHLDCFAFFTPLATPTAKADPTGLVFYTTTGSRLYKTTDGAATWSQVIQFGTVDNPDCRIRPIWNSVGLHPTDPRRIALTGTGGRVFISLDAGATWSASALNTLVPGFHSSTSTVAWARDGSTLYVSSENVNPGVVRLAKSTDAGATWARADGSSSSHQLPNVAVNHMVVNPRDPHGRTVYAGTDLGVYVTRNGGMSWSLFGAGLPNVSVRGLYLSPDEGFIRVATYGRGVWEIDTDD